MAKQGRHRKGGRVTPKGTRPLHAVESFRYEPDPEPDLLSDVRQALRQHPLGFLEMVSTMVTLVDARQRDPFDRTSPETTAEALVDSFIGVPRAETSAVLTAFAALTTDEVVRTRIQRELAHRSHPLPRWLARLDEAEVYGATEMVHVLGDGDNIMLGARLADGQELSVVVYIDHNMGTLVKDAFGVAQSVGATVELYRTKGADPDTRFTPLDPADARARVAEAIAKGARSYPRFETETWPACRPLVEWLIGRLPEGGVSYETPEWNDEQLREIAERFLASPFATDLDTDQVALLDDVLWFGSGYGPGDPLRWSAVAVEIILLDWIPRKIVAGVDHLEKAPSLLRSFIGWCHHERGIRPSLTEETLAAVDRWEPDYQEIIRSARPQGPLAILDAMGVLHEDRPWQQFVLDDLQEEVGGADALDVLDAVPLPDEPFSWDGIPGDVVAQVGAVVGLTDACADALLDVEHRTAFRRFLHRTVVGDPAPFRRKAKPEGLAATVCWAIGSGNDTFRRGILVKDLLAWFGVGSVSDRGKRLLAAAGCPEGVDSVVLGSPTLLVSQFRREIIERRDQLRAEGT